MRNPHYVVLPWTLHVPVLCEYAPTLIASAGTLVDLDVELSFLDGYLEGVLVTLERGDGQTFEHEIGEHERDRVLRCIWNTAIKDCSDDALKHALADRMREAREDARVAAAEHRWEQATGR